MLLLLEKSLMLPLILLYFNVYIIHVLLPTTTVMSSLNALDVTCLTRHPLAEDVPSVSLGIEPSLFLYIENPVIHMRINLKTPLWKSLVLLLKPSTDLQQFLL